MDGRWGQQTKTCTLDVIYLKVRNFLSWNGHFISRETWSRPPFTTLLLQNALSLGVCGFKNDRLSVDRMTALFWRDKTYIYSCVGTTSFRLKFLLATRFPILRVLDFRFYLTQLKTFLERTKILTSKKIIRAPNLWYTTYAYSLEVFAWFVTLNN